jgi:PilZ domain
MERRLHQRNQVHFEAKVTSLTSRAHSSMGRVSDLSQSGISVVLPLQLVPGESVQLEMADSVITGRVIYSNPENSTFRAGIEVQKVDLGASSLADLLQRTLMLEMPGLPGLEPSETRLC